MTNPNPKRSSPRGEDIPRKSQDNSAPRNTRDKRNEAAPQRLQDKPAPRNPTTRFTLPDLPRAQWCDIRTSYIERGLTLVELAEIYQCDYRTIKACLIRNKSSKSFGKKSTPTRLAQGTRLQRQRADSPQLPARQSLSKSNFRERNFHS